MILVAQSKKSTGALIFRQIILVFTLLIVVSGHPTPERPFNDKNSRPECSHQVTGPSNCN